MNENTGTNKFLVDVGDLFLSSERLSGKQLKNLKISPCVNMKVAKL